MTWRRQTERNEQAQIVQLLRSLGASVWTLGTTRKRGDHAGTMQSPGLPDLLAFMPAKLGHEARQLLVVEVKTPGARVRPEQLTFRDLCHAAGIPHVLGGIDALFAWLIENAYLRREQVGHYHQRA